MAGVRPSRVRSGRRKPPGTLEVVKGVGARIIAAVRSGKVSLRSGVQFRHWFAPGHPKSGV